MPQWVDEISKRTARTVNLYDFLLSWHPDRVGIEGDSLRLRDNHSISIKRGYCGYTDFSNGATGNAVDFLVNFLGYGFQDAVSTLCEFAGTSNISTSGALPQNSDGKAPQMPQDALQAATPVNPAFVPPEPLQGPYRQLYAYLTQERKIPLCMVQQLIDWGLLYQEKDHANMVFIDAARTFAELRGSNSFKVFHRVMFSDPAAFWWFKCQGPDSIPTVAFICEAAIDAVSLYVLRRAAGTPAAENGLYCSIGGVANQQRIDRIKAGMSAGGCPTVIAVDNDKAGEECRRRNSDCEKFVPTLKDWNADLIAVSAGLP